MWTLDQLRTFKLAAERKNFSQAGERLNISAAAVGKQIKLLETALGSQLFYRTTRHVSLTEFGDAFYEHCERILHEVEKTADFVHASQGVVTGKLKIVSSLFFGESYLVPTLGKFLAAHPQVVIDLELADRIADIETEQIDLLIGLMAGLPPHYVARQLKLEHYILCASPRYLEQRGVPKTPDDLVQHAYITHSKRPNPPVLIFKEEKTVHVRPVLWTNHTGAMLQWCLEGLGIAMLHADVVKKYLMQNALVEILQTYQQPPQPIYLYFKKVHYLQPKIRAFIDHVLSEVNNL